METGRYIKSGAFELALGEVAAEKLKVGIPQRPTRSELEREILPLATSPGDRDMIAGLYRLAEGGGIFTPEDELAPGDERLALSRDASAADLARYWDILDGAGRNDVRVSVVIDIKAAPETVSFDKWDVNIAPLVTAEERALLEKAYEREDFMGAWVLNTEDPALLDAALAAMIRVDYTGAVRHVNQLFTAKVVGVVNSPDPENNANVAYIPLDVLQDETGMMLEGHITELLIRAKGASDASLPGEKESAEAITAALEAGLARRGKTLPPELAVRTWLDYVADYIGYENMETAATTFLSVLLLVLCFLGISNTMLLAILERTKEIGMMRALGMTNGQLVMTYMLEAGFIAFIGSILGVIAGCAINFPMVKYGIDMSGMMEAMGGGSMGYRVNGVFRSIWNIPAIVGAAIAATLVGSFMAFFPTRRAVKKPITESLRFE
jgi:hypothetical protein